MGWKCSILLSILYVLIVYTLKSFVEVSMILNQ